MAAGCGHGRGGVPELFCVHVLKLMQRCTNEKVSFTTCNYTHTQRLPLVARAMREHAVSGLHFLVKAAVERDVSLSRAAPGQEGGALLPAARLNPQGTGDGGGAGSPETLCMLPNIL